MADDAHTMEISTNTLNNSVLGTSWLATARRVRHPSSMGTEDPMPGSFQTPPKVPLYLAIYL